MALLHMDGCDTYSALADAALRYPGSNTSGMGFSTTLGRFGGCCIAPGSQNTSAPSYLGGISVSPSGSTAIIAGGAVLPTTNISGPILCFYNSTAASSQTELYLDYSGGFFRLYRGYAVTLLATATIGHVNNVWHHIEVKAVVADSGGSCEVRVNGQTVINYSGDTRNTTTGTAGIDRVYFCSPGSSNSMVQGGWDDFYVMDTGGSAPLNDFIGDCRVVTLAPTSDAAVAFTRSAGASNYLTVDEGRQNGDTDYVESATVGHIDRYGYGDLAAAVSTVRAVQAITWARKTDAATRTMRNIIVSGGTTATGTSYPLLTGYAPYVTLLTTDPATASAWTPSAVNALTAGFEVVS